MSTESFLMKIRNQISKSVYCVATLISPKLNTKLHYRRAFKKKLDLNNPKTLNEKLLWLKLNKYMKDPLVIQCADKYAVRDYIKDCGCEEILNDLIAVYDSPEEIDWDALPEKFVLKWNFGAGMNIICDDKSKLDKEATLKQLKKWGKCKFWLHNSEMQYKYAPKKIICENYLKDDFREVLTDFKVYSFHGEPQAILVMNDRGGQIKAEFFDSNWNALESGSKYCKPKVSTERPVCFSQMLHVTRKLSKPFPFVRCDFYVVNDKLYFGELTFTPAGGLYTSQTKINGKEMTDFLDLNR